MTDTIEDRAREWLRQIDEDREHGLALSDMIDALRAEGNRALEEAAQASRDQTCDHPSFVGDWNDACEHVATRILALRT